jgi:hypothetical protein
VNVLPHRRSLPVQVRLLIPVERSERFFRLVNLIHTRFPPVSCRIFLLGIAENNDPDTHLAMRQDIEELARELPSDFHADILIRTGDIIRILMHAARQNHVDLVILAYEPDFSLHISNTKTSISSILRKLRMPVMLLPGKANPTTGGPVFPFRNSLALLNAEESTRLGTAFALRSIRLLCDHTVLAACSRSKDKVHAYLSFIRQRYWPPESTETCRLQVFTGTATRALKASLQRHNPDFIVVSLQDRSYIERFRLAVSLKSALSTGNRAVLIINRPDWIGRQEKQLTRIYRNLSEFDLAYSPSSTDDSHPSGDITMRKPALFMGCYSPEGLREVFRNYGLFHYLKRKGYPDAHIVFDKFDAGRERLRVFPGKQQGGDPLVDLVLRREFMPAFNVSADGFPDKPGSFLHVEWLCLQDPQRSYRDLETPLPGQKYPGLGIGWKVMIIIKLLACRLGAAGVYNIPEYYHTARLYHRFFRYRHPELEGRLLAIDRDTFPVHVVDVSWAFLHGLVYRNNQPSTWSGGAQILPLNQKLKAYFTSADYLNRMQITLQQERFYLDMPGLRDMMMNRRLYKEPGL